MTVDQHLKKVNMYEKPKTIEEECTEAATTVTEALLNSFVFNLHIAGQIRTWLIQRITLVMLNQQIRQRPREEEAYCAGYEQGFNDCRAGRLPDNSLKHEN